MIKEKRNRIFLAVFLAVLIMLPQFIKDVHIFVVHHEHKSFTAGIINISGLYFIDHQCKCPICQFELVPVINEYNSVNLEHPEIILETIQEIYNDKYITTNQLLNYNLRAPPFAA